MYCYSQKLTDYKPEGAYDSAGICGIIKKVNHMFLGRIISSYMPYMVQIQCS